MNNKIFSLLHLTAAVALCQFGQPQEFQALGIPAYEEFSGQILNPHQGYPEVQSMSLVNNNFVLSGAYHFSSLGSNSSQIDQVIKVPFSLKPNQSAKFFFNLSTIHCPESISLGLQHIPVPNHDKENDDLSLFWPGIINSLSPSKTIRFGMLNNPSYVVASLKTSSLDQPDYVKKFSRDAKSGTISPESARSVIAVVGHEYFVLLEDCMKCIIKKRWNQYQYALKRTQNKETYRLLFEKQADLCAQYRQIKKWHFVQAYQSIEDQSNNTVLVGLGVNPFQQLELFSFKCSTAELHKALGLNPPKPAFKNKSKRSEKTYDAYALVDFFF